MLLRSSFNTSHNHSNRCFAQSAIPLGLSSPHIFASTSKIKTVANWYRLPLALRGSCSWQNSAYKLPTSNTCPSPVIHSISTSFGFVWSLANQSITEEGLFFTPFWTLSKPCHTPYSSLTFGKITVYFILRNMVKFIYLPCQF